MRRVLVALAAVAVLLMLPALLAGFGPTDSNLYNYVWTKQFAAELARGNLYPRWLPDSFEGLGSPTFYFYPPLAYYVSGLLALALPVQTAVAAAATVFTFLSGATMYAWLRGKTRHALLAAILYMAAPYHLIDVYVRGALAEAAAFMWLPLIALAVERLETRRGPPLLAAAYAGLIFTHLPTAVLVSVFLIPLLVLARRPFEARFVARAATGIALGLMLAAPYLLPALSLLGTIHREVFTSIRLDPQAWNPWSLPPWNAARFETFALIALGWSILSLGVLRRAPAWAGLSIVAAACSLALVPQFWTLPVLHDVQFPWRLLVIVEFAAVTALALQPPRRRLLAAGFGLLGAIALQEIDLRGRPLPPQVDRHMIDAVEYLPADFHASELVTGLDPDLSSLSVPRVQGPASASAVQPDGRVELTVAAPGRVVFRRANFPAWRVRGPSGDVPVAPGPLISFEASPGRYAIERAPLPAEQVGWVLALLAVVGMGLWQAPRATPTALPASSP